MVIRRALIISVVAAGLIGLAGFAAFAVAGAAGRSDCPGKIVCPQTGERVCRDRCPLNKGEATAANDTPACCRARK